MKNRRSIRNIVTGIVFLVLFFAVPTLVFRGIRTLDFAVSKSISAAVNVAVPEPASVGLLLRGLVFLSVFRKLRLRIF